jgi:hypothetical protein
MARNIKTMSERELLEQLLEVVPEALRRSDEEIEDEVINRGTTESGTREHYSDDGWTEWDDGEDWYDGDEMDQEAGDQYAEAEITGEGGEERRTDGVARPMTEHEQSMVRQEVEAAIQAAEAFTSAVKKGLKDPKLDLHTAREMAKAVQKLCGYITPSMTDVRHDRLRDMCTRLGTVTKRQKRKGQTGELSVVDAAHEVNRATRRRVSGRNRTMRITNQVHLQLSGIGQATAPAQRGRPQAVLRRLEYMG